VSGREPEGSGAGVKGTADWQAAPEPFPFQGSVPSSLLAGEFLAVQILYRERLRCQCLVRPRSLLWLRRPRPGTHRLLPRCLSSCGTPSAPSTKQPRGACAAGRQQDGLGGRVRPRGHGGGFGEFRSVSCPFDMCVCVWLIPPWRFDLSSLLFSSRQQRLPDIVGSLCCFSYPRCPLNSG
jgi:hypothetical protein